MPDLDINCAECGSSFPFTEREQDYYRERGLTHPKRCKPCRDARRQNFAAPGKAEEAAVAANGNDSRLFAISAGRVTVFRSSPGGSARFVRRVLCRQPRQRGA